MSKVTEMGTAQINGHDTITVELVETDETPTVVRARPASYSPTIPRRSEHGGLRVFAAAATQLAAIKRDRKL